MHHAVSGLQNSVFALQLVATTGFPWLIASAMPRPNPSDLWSERYTSLAAVHYARDEHDRMHVALGFVGVLVSVLCLSLLIVPIPQLGTSLSKESYIILFTWVALGVNFFTPTLVRQGREG